MSIYNYVGVPNNNLTCCICRTPFTDPVTTRTCAHTFCQECILKALTHSPHCPVDRSPLAIADLGPANPIVRSLVDELIVECIHFPEGCKHTCQRLLLAAHLKEECEYSEVECTEEGCEKMLTRMEMDEHMKMHNKEEKKQASDVTQTDQQPETDRSPVASTSKSSESSAPSPSVQDRQIALLTEQNILLKRRVSVLEGGLQTMQKEMSAVKSALGPWFRPTGSVNYHAGVVPSSELPVDIQSLAASTSGSHPGRGASFDEWRGGGYEAYSYPYSNTHPGGPMLGTNALAPYFPSGVEEHPHHSHHVIEQRVPGHRVSSSVSDLQQGPGGVFPAPPRGMSIAPLDLDTTLEGTLIGLRESIVALGAGVDSLGRRSEIALTNETLRLGEEVMSLRAGLHGLRMQVHAMMMDRNAQITGRGGGSEGMGMGEMGSWIGPPAMHVAGGPRVYFPMQGSAQGGPSITKL